MDEDGQRQLVSRDATGGFMSEYDGMEFIDQDLPWSRAFKCNECGKSATEVAAWRL